MIPIIAEPGSTHEGDRATMHRLIDVAADCGATAIKPQWTSSPEAMVRRRRAPAYLESYHKLATPLEWHAEWADHAAQRGLRYLVSVYLPVDALRVAPFASVIKIASFEALDRPLLDAATRTHRPVYVSTGMLALDEVRDIAPYATMLLHCTSSYPAPIDSLNLRAIPRMAAATGVPIGYSDHSRDVQVGGLAVAAGATALEVHVRLDDCDPANPDYAVAFGPDEFRAYVHTVRVAERALGDGRKGAQAAEAEMQRYRVVPA